MASVTRCPFRCLAGARGQEPGAPSGRPECPFKSLLRTSSSEWVVPSKSDHDPVQEAPVQTAASDSKPQATKCPLGFVAGSEPSMDVLNCSVCGALLHEAVELDCAHRACMYCATRATCCGACGKKSESVRSDPTMQAVVDLYISSHGGSAAGGNGAQDGAAFFLEVGLSSMAGGNLEAAYSRLQSCAEAVTSGQSETEDELESICRLAVVQGALGDCSKRLGNQRAAVTHYSESCAHWLKASTAGSQVEDNLATMYSKLGDAAISEDVSAAVEAYRKGLAIRRAAAGKNLQHVTPHHGLKLCVCMIKVADACQELGEVQEAKSLNSQARKLLKRLSSQEMTEQQKEQHQKFRDFLASTS